MSRSTLALKRLGVAGVAAVTIGAGIPAFFATSASAAPATQLSISPAPGQAAAGTCQVFTISATDGNGSPATYPTSATPAVTIELTESPVTTTQNVSFCDTTGSFANSTTAGEQTGTDPSVTARTTRAFTRTAPQNADGSAGTVTATTPTTATFGVRGLQPGGANIRAFIDANANNAFDAGELQVLTSTSFTAGGANTSSNQTGGNAAQDAVTTLADTSKNSTTYTAGSSATFTVQVKNSAGNTVSGVAVSARITGGPNGAQPAPAGSAAGTPGTAAANVTCTGSDNNGESVCQYTLDATRTGTDSIQVYVNQTSGSTSGPDASEPTITLSRTVAPQPTTDQTLARNITVTPSNKATAAGQSANFTATVITGTGRPVQGTTVTVREEGPGRFNNGASTITGTTDATGSVVFQTDSVVGETGTEIITASISAAGTQCDNPAGTPAGAAGTTAGNCSATATQTFSASGSPSPSTSGTASPSPSATSTVSPSASPSPSSSTPAGTNPPSPSSSTNQACVTPATVTLQQTTIIATGSAGVTVKATANSVIDLFAYTRPSTTFRMVRSAEVGADGTANFRVVPPANTRFYAQQRGCTTDIAAASKVLNVRTAISLFAKRNGTRDYTFSGDSLPARSGGLIISLYRVTDSGRQVLTSQVRASASNGQWVINRRFTGEGRFGFVVRTGQDLQNAPGSSNIRPTLIY